MLVLPFPDIDPVALVIGPLSIRWYALAYLAGILGGWWYAIRLTYLYKGRADRTVNHVDIDDLVPWVVGGIVLGGRLGYVLFYNLPYFIGHPLDAFKIWQGGMSFHGGAAGVILVLVGFALFKKLSLLNLGDIVCCVVPIGLFFGRIANFINAELYGRVSTGPLGVVFPGTDGQPRHPSQLYEAALEGLLLFIILFVMACVPAVRNRDGVIAGTFLFLYGAFRFLVEFVREPDAHIGFVVSFFSMGQLLCTPMMAAGAALIAYACLRHNKTA